jgi:excisionase family DNA binding protein
MEDTEGKFLTPSEVAELLGVAPDKITFWIATRQLIAVNIALRAGGKPRWRISRASLDAFLRSREAQGATDAH